MTEYRAQRRFPRMESENSLLVRSLDDRRQEGFVKTQVVGLGGCMFVNDAPLGVGTRLEILFAVDGRVGRSRGRVVYEVPRRFGRVEVGVEFLGIAPDARDVLRTLFARAGHA